MDARQPHFRSIHDIELITKTNAASFFFLRAALCSTNPHVFCRFLKRRFNLQCRTSPGECRRDRPEALAPRPARQFQPFPVARPRNRQRPRRHAGGQDPQDHPALRCPGQRSAGIPGRTADRRRMAAARPRCRGQGPAAAAALGCRLEQPDEVGHHDVAHGRPPGAERSRRVHLQPVQPGHHRHRVQLRGLQQPGFPEARRGAAGAARSGKAP